MAHSSDPAGSDEKHGQSLLLVFSDGKYQQDITTVEHSKLNKNLHGSLTGFDIIDSY